MLAKQASGKPDLREAAQAFCDWWAAPGEIECHDIAREFDERLSPLRSALASPDPLVEKVAELEKLVESGFREGVTSGLYDGALWSQSQTKRRLDAIMGRK